MMKHLSLTQIENDEPFVGANMIERVRNKAELLQHLYVATVLKLNVMKWGNEMNITGLTSGLFFLIVFFVLLAASVIKIPKEYERGVIFRLGRLIGAKGPGLILIIPWIDKLVKVSLRTITMDIPTQDVVTRDNISIKVNAWSIFVSWIPIRQSLR